MTNPGEPLPSYMLDILGWVDERYGVPGAETECIPPVPFDPCPPFKLVMEGDCDLLMGGKAWVRGNKPSAAAERRSVAEGFLELEADEDARPRRFTMLLVREGGSGSPRIGAVDEIGEPGSTPTDVRVGGGGDEEEGALYTYVAARTMDEPVRKAMVMG